MSNPTRTPRPWEIQVPTIAGGDPVLKLLSKAKIPPIVFGVVYAVGVQCVRVLVAWVAGHLRTVGRTTGVLDDPSLITNAIFAAVIVSYYSWMPKGIASVFNRLYNNGVIGDPISRSSDEESKTFTYASLVNELQTSLGKWWWSAASLMASGVAVLILAPQYWARRNSVGWIADPVSLVLALLWAAVGVYCVGLVLIYGLLTTYWLRRLFTSFTTKIRPLHPDGAGGLAPIGSFTLRLSYLIAMVGIILVATSINRNYVDTGTLQFYWTSDIVLALGIYAIAAPTVFFAPLGAAHRSMAEAKDELLLEISRRFQTEYAHVWRALDDDIGGPASPTLGSASISDQLKVLDELQSLHETTGKFPVWPFNASNLARFGTSFLSPLALALMSSLLSGLLMP